MKTFVVVFTIAVAIVVLSFKLQFLRIIWGEDMWGPRIGPGIFRIALVLWVVGVIVAALVGWFSP